MKRSVAITFVTAIFASVLFSFTTHAGKPDNPGGGNGGGGGGGNPGNEILVAQLETADGVGTHDHACDVNGWREVVGQVHLPSGDSSAAYWTVDETDGVVQSTLSLLNGGYLARSINNLGEIVGETYDEFGNVRAVYWQTPTATPTMLPLVSGDTVSWAAAISNDGVICGSAGADPQDSQFAVVWRVTSEGISDPIELPADGDGSGSSAHALNDNDDSGVAQVVGYQRSEVAGEGGPFLWEVQSHDDGTVSVSSVVSLDDGNPSAINNSGLICGRLIGRSPSDVDALVWSGDTVSFLDRGKGRNKVAGARARDISDTGIIVGEAGDNLIFDSRACFWNGIDGSLTYLDDYLNADSPLIGLNRAEAVNVFGDIVGVGWNGAFIAIPASP